MLDASQIDISHKPLHSNSFFALATIDFNTFLDFRPVERWKKGESHLLSRISKKKRVY